MRFIFATILMMSLMVHASGNHATAFSLSVGIEENQFDNPILELMAINPVSVQITLRDMSTDDTLYEIYRTNSGSATRTLVRSFVAPDSGGLYIVLDYPGSSGIFTYSVDVTAGGVVYSNQVSASVNTSYYNPMTYPTPENSLGVNTTETSFVIEFRNPVPGALTEIYRAPTHEGPFELIVTMSGETGRYIDSGLTPGTTYYYTFRGVLGEQTSAFAGIGGRTTFKDFKIPEFSAEALPDGSVRIILHDRGLSDVRYELIREGGGSGELIETFVLPDSGTVLNYIDDNVLPDITYAYILDVFLQSGGGTVGVDTVTTYSLVPDLGYFYLVDPTYDAEMGYYVIDGFVNEFADVNIGAQANDLTKSVVFHLDGKQSIDNAPPFAVLPDTEGDFESLNLRNGVHTLTAIAYPQQDGGGTPGDTSTVTFSVNVGDCTSGCFTLVNADTDEDISEIEGGETFIKPVDSFFNVRFNAVDDPGSVEFKIEDNIFRVENAPPFSLAGDLSGDYLPWRAGLAGSYTIVATPWSGPNRTGVAGQPVSISFTIVQPELTEARFTIVNADTDEDIQPLNDGDVFVKSAGTNINIRYDAINNPGSVVFRHQNKIVRTENAAPFSLRGDYNGNYLPWAGAVQGDHRIDATPYSGDRGQGTAGQTLTVNFTIVEDANANLATRKGESGSIEIYPNPVPTGNSVLTISGFRAAKERIQTFVEIVNMNGDVVFSEKVDCDGNCDGYVVAVKKNLAPGLYLIRVESNSGRDLRRLLVK